MKKDEIIIYTDGSSLGNPGPGGWGSVLLFPDGLPAQAGKVVELGGREKESTNNRMEMMASIMALKEVEKKSECYKNSDRFCLFIEWYHYVDSYLG